VPRTGMRYIATIWAEDDTITSAVETLGLQVYDRPAD